MEKKTTTTKKVIKKKPAAPKIVRNTHELDATGQILGRFATNVATLLRGKHKATYTPNLDGGDIVVISNASKIKLSGKKIDQKVYYRHSGYPGGLKETKIRDLVEKNPTKLLRDTIYHMLPKNRMRDKIIKRLKISN